jgi:hypothetical protein
MLTAGGMRQRGNVMSGGSFKPSSDFRVHFGFGQTTMVDKVEIRWPDGVKERVTLPSVARYFAVEEGRGLVPSVYDAISEHRAKSAEKHAGM